VAFATNEGAFLAGAAAALTSDTGKVGFIGAFEFSVIKDFELGFTAGALSSMTRSRFM
jgi:basic membrane protein A